MPGIEINNQAYYSIAIETKTSRAMTFRNVLVGAVAVLTLLMLIAWQLLR